MRQPPPEQNRTLKRFRVALWRAMPPPHVLEDEIGLKLAAPPDGWRRRHLPGKASA
jgi:hypothetical protein